MVCISTIFADAENFFVYKNIRLSNAFAWKKRINQTDYLQFSLISLQIHYIIYALKKVVKEVLKCQKRNRVLRCIESGTTPSYTIIANYENELRNSNHTFIWGSVYGNQKESFVNDIKVTSKYFNSIKGAEISKYTIVNEYVKITEFDNGAWAVVNYGDTDYESEFGVFK